MRLFQYQTKTEPVFVPAAPADTSAVEFAATSPSFSVPVWVKAAVVAGTIVTGFGLTDTGDAAELRDFTQLADVVRPIERAVSAPFLFFDAEPIAAAPAVDFGWFQALSSVPDHSLTISYLSRITTGFAVTTPFLPGDATELREFIQLPDVVRPVPRAVYVQEPIPLTTVFLPGDAAALREFIPFADVIRSGARAVSAPFLFFDPEPIPDVIGEIREFIQLPDVVRPVAKAISDPFLFFEPELVAPSPPPNPLTWYQQLSEPVREPPQAIPSAPYEPVVQFPGDATELAEFIPFADVIRPPEKAINTSITAFAVKTAQIKWFQALSDPIWPVEHAVYVQYDPIPLATPFLPGDADAFREFIQLPDVVRPPARVVAPPSLFEPLIRRPGPANELLTFIQLPDVIRPVPRVAQQQFLALDPDVLITIDLREGWYQALSEPVRPLERAVYVQDPIFLTTEILSGNATELREFIQLPDVVRLPERVTAPPSFFEPLIKRPGPANELAEFIQLPDVVRPVVRAVSAPFLFFDPFPIPGVPAAQLLTFIQLPDVVRPLALTHAGFFTESLEPIAPPVVPDFGWFQLPAEVIHLPQGLTRGTIFTGFSFGIDAAGELLTFIQLPDVVRPVEHAQHTTVTGFALPITELPKWRGIGFPDPYPYQLIPVNEGGNFQRLLTPQELLDLIPNYGYFRPFSEPMRLSQLELWREGGVYQRLLTPQELANLIPNFGYFQAFSEPARLALRTHAALLGGGVLQEPVIVVPAPKVGVYIPTFRRRRR